MSVKGTDVKKTIMENQENYNCTAIGTLVQQVIKEAETGVMKAQITLSTGYENLDRITDGLQPGHLIVAGGRPAMGKTAFALSMARNIAVGQNKPIAYFSLEMSKIELTRRLVSTEAGINIHKLKSGELKEHELEQLVMKTGALEKAPIFIDDSAFLNVSELGEKCRLLKQKHDIQFVIVDYLQLMQTSDKQELRKEQICEILQHLKVLAKELNLPILVLVQSEKRGDLWTPRMFDLGNAKNGVEENADLVMFVHRPEHYGVIEDEDGYSTHGIADIIIEKNRHGAKGVARLKFVKEHAKFENLDVSNYDDYHDENEE